MGQQMNYKRERKEEKVTKQLMDLSLYAHPNFAIFGHGGGGQFFWPISYCNFSRLEGRFFFAKRGVGVYQNPSYLPFKNDMPTYAMY